MKDGNCRRGKYETYVVDDHRNRLHVDTASEHVCSNEDLSLTIPKLIDYLVSIGAFKGTMKSSNFMSLCLHALLNLVGSRTFLCARSLEINKEPTNC
jgi:hypothetical protein